MWYVMTEMQSTTAEDNSSKLADIYIYIIYSMILQRGNPTIKPSEMCGKDTNW